jgi:hypothetical protein
MAILLLLLGLSTLRTNDLASILPMVCVAFLIAGGNGFVAALGGGRRRGRRGR